jgi:endoglucanase
MKLGWNLGNSLDAPEGETAWGNPAVTQELLQAVADAGFGVVRIPVTWSLHLGPAPSYTIEPAWLARVDEVVGYALDAGLHAIINLHHDGADDYDGVEWLKLTDAAGAISTETNAAVEAQFVQVWTQLATHFVEHDERLWLESMNEIHDGYDAPDPAYYGIINHLNQQFVDTVRATGGRNAERFLVVPGYNTNVDYTLAGFEAPSDSVADRLILSVHYYDPWSFAGEASTPVWGSASAGTDTWGQEDHVVSQFDKLKAQFVDQGLPVMIGEYGAVNQAGYENYRRYYMEFVTKAARDRGLLPVYWDNGGQGSGMDNFGLFDRATGSVTQAELLETLRRAANDAYTLDEVALP